MTWKSKENPMFRSQFSESIFKHKYAHEGCETWEKLSDVLVEDVCRDKLSKDEKFELKRIIRELKFIPGGRYLYYAGRPAKFFNNCGNSETLLLTDRGFRQMGDFSEGEEVSVYSPVSKQFEKATMHTHGVQPMNEIHVKRKSASSATKVIKFTPNHKWPTKNRGDVTDLSPGDILSCAEINIEHDEIGFIHGAVFADGNVHLRKKKKDFAHQLRLCGKKSEYVNLFSNYTITYPSSAEGDPIVYIPSSMNFKELPPDGMSLEYIKGFILGWTTFDGHNPKEGSCSIHTTNKQAIDWFVKNAPVAGFTLTGEVCSTWNGTNYGERTSELFHVRFVPTSDFKDWIVTDVKSTNKEIAYCPFEPKYNRIVVDYGIDTFQCYLLRAEEDSREDWANLSWKAESCLMTGGGIGADYSRYRGKGHNLSKTGGKSSGPIPKMEMLNEQGRRVMQGGSRRSAIYASLVHSHPDIFDFLVAKNWQNMKVKGTKYTLADLKQLDFNFPCPLDMTNVSVNYDTAWVEHYKKTGDVGEVFLKNIIQALSTAEPGFSFNFYDKEDETLRNA